MNQFEISTQVENQPKKGEQSNQEKARINKFLAASSLKSSFQFSFESLFLDMFSPIAEAPKVEMKEVRAEPDRRYEPKNSDEKKEVEPLPLVREVARESKAPEKPAEKPRAQEDGPKHAETKPVEVRSDEAKDDDKPVKADEEIKETDEGKILMADIKNFIEKIDSLLADEDLSLEELTAETMKLLEDLVGELIPVHVEVRQFQVTDENTIKKIVSDMLDAGEDADAGKKRDFLKKLLARLRDMLDQADDRKLTDQKQIGVQATNDTDDNPTERKVDDAIMRMMKKLDKPETIELDPRKLERPQAEVKPLELNVDAEKDHFEKRALRAAREGQDTKAKEVAKPVRADVDAPLQSEKNVRIVAQEAATAQVRSRGNGAEVKNHGQAVKAVAEAGPASKGGDAGNQPSWQNSYNNSASQKGLDLGRSTQAKESRQSQQTQQQQKVFDQIVQNAKITIENGKGEATIKLNPDFLGKVEMKVTVEDKQATVKFSVENSAVRAAITENVAELRRSLMELGLDVAEIEVVLTGESGDKQGDDAAGENRSRGDGSGEFYALGEAEALVEQDRRVTVEEVDGSTVRYVA